MPNQKIIEICTSDAHQEKPYGIITEKEMILAARLLNDKSASHILYYYFALNQDGYRFALSPSAIYRECGIKKKQYDLAIKKLTQTGYLVRSKTGGNVWIFMRIPEQYKDIRLEDIESDVTTLPIEEYPARNIASSKNNGIPSKGASVPPLAEIPPTSGESNNTPSDRGRNIINNTNNTNNTDDGLYLPF